MYYYRKELEEEEQDSGMVYTFYENYELTDLGLEKVKRETKIPENSENSIIKYENVKCSKKCKHKTHKYFYAYFWESVKYRIGHILDRSCNSLSCLM